MPQPFIRFALCILASFVFILSPAAKSYCDQIQTQQTDTTTSAKTAIEPEDNSDTKSAKGDTSKRPDQETFKLDMEIGGVGMAEIEDGPAELGYAQARVSAKYHGFSFGYEFRNYRWSGTKNLPFAPDWEDPFNEMHAVWLGYERRGSFNRQWGWWLFGRASSAFEDDILGLPTAILGGAISYAMSNGFIISGGIFGSYNQADQFVLPYLGLTYRAGAKSGISGTLGFPFTSLNYHLTEKLFLKARVGFIRRTYKLADDNPARPEGEFRTQEFSSGLSVNYAFTKNWEAVLGADYLFARQITMFDDGGNGGSDYDLDNTWGAYAKLTFKF